MKRTLYALGCSLCLLVLHAQRLAAAEPLLRDGDRIVFLGDSITEQRLYTTYLEAYALTRHPNWKLWFRNVGWGGDTAWLRQRAHPDEGKLFAAEPDAQQKMVEDSVGRGLARDVLPLKPTGVTVKFGMNDHSYQAFREDIFRAYVRSQTQISKVLQEHGARVAFLTPQPIEDKRPDPDKDVRNQSLRKFSDGLKDVAASTGAGYVDQFDPYMELMLKARAQNGSATIGGGDAVHPGPPGHTLMAWAILKGLGAGSLVSRAEIDVAGKKVSATEGCRLSNLSVSGDTVSFDRLDEALPMPIDTRATAALDRAPVLDDLSHYDLRVTGLPAGTYDLRIDDESAAKLSSEQLAAGCNLTIQAGPVTAQAQQVLRLVFEKNNLFFSRWRNVQLFDVPTWARSPEVTAALESKRNSELQRLDDEIAGVEKQIDAARLPKSRHFTLKRAAP